MHRFVSLSTFSTIRFLFGKRDISWTSEKSDKALGELL
jgi:hypothetical protein